MDRARQRLLGAGAGGLDRQKVALSPAVIARPCQMRTPRQPAEGGKRIGQRLHQPRRQPLGRRETGRARIIRCRPLGQRAGQPVDRFGRQQDGRGRHPEVEAKTQPLPGQFGGDHPAGQRRIGRGRVAEGRQPVVAVEGHDEAPGLEREDRRGDGVALRVAFQQQQQFAVGQPVVEAQTRRAIVRRRRHRRMGEVENRRLSHLPSPRPARPLRPAAGRPRTTDCASASRYCARKGAARQKCAAHGRASAPRWR